MTSYRVTFIFLLIISSLFSAEAKVIFSENGTSDDKKILLYKGNTEVMEPLNLDLRRFVEVPYRLSLGYDRKKKWFLITAENRTNKKIEQLLLLDDGFMFDEVNFYHVINSKIVKVIQDGGNIPTIKKEAAFSGAITKVTIPPNTNISIFVSIKAKTPILTSLRVVSIDHFYRSNTIHNMILTAISAALISISFYNLFLFFSLRLREYLYYVVYVISAVVFFLAQSGFMNEFFGITGDTRTWMFISVYSMGIFFMLFSQTVLETKKNLPIMHIVLHIITFLNIVGIIAAFIFGMKQTLFLQTPFAQLTAIVLAIVGFLAVYKKINAAMYYIIADGIGIVGIIVSSMFYLGYTEYNVYTRYAYFTASVCESILLSLLLSYRINSFRKQKIEAQENLILFQKEQNEKLEYAVKERTEELDRKNQELEYLSVVDEMTGLYNRRFLSATFDDKINKVRNDEKLLAFLMVDVDFFKNYNDTYGHQAGDNVLKTVAIVLCNSFKRSSDYVFRIGGEEFVVLYFVDSYEEGHNFAETVRKNMISEKIPHINGCAEKVVTMYLGLCVAKAGTLSFDKYYKLADEQLYAAKNCGRNKVCSIEITPTS